jgi:hypothetical protein
MIAINITDIFKGDEYIKKKKFIGYALTESK